VPTRAVTRAALVAVAGLAVAGLAVIYLRFEHGYRYFYGLAPLLDPAREANVPTWFSSSLLLLTGVALALAGARLKAAGSRDARWWLALAAVACLASLDETANLHELLSQQARRAYDFGFGQVWVLFVGPLAGAFILVCRRFVLRQEPRVRRPLVLGTALLAGGALGVELVEILLERSGAGPVTVALTLLAQELLELLGAVTLLHAALTNLPAR
jgi:hypothetical protein